MDNPSTMETLIAIGRIVAERHVRPEHFPEIFHRTIWPAGQKAA
jgi:hypothetical protein